MIRPPKSVLLQYIYDYGLDKAAALFHIDIETADKIINWKPQYDQYSYNTVIDKPLHRNASKIADIIAKHYPELVKQYTTYNKDTIYNIPDCRRFPTESSNKMYGSRTGRSNRRICIRTTKSAIQYYKMLC